MKSAAIVNGRIPARRRPHLEMPIHVTERHGHARVLAMELARSGIDRLYVAGGDGTVHEVANGVLEAATSTEIAVLPCGTGNDLARILGPSVRTIDVGVVETTTERRHFVNIADVGFGAEVTLRMNRWGRSLCGAMAYQTGILSALLSYRPDPCEILIDGRRFETLLANLIVANGRYFGRGLCPAPLAQPDDGLLDILLLGPLTRWEILTNMPKLRGEQPIRHPKVQSYRGKHIEVRTRGLPVEADGEYLGCTPAAFSILPKALRILAGE